MASQQGTGASSRGVTVIRDVAVISLDPAIGVREPVDITVSDGRFLAIGPALPAPDGAEVIDGRAMVAMPGFIDGHRHLWEGVIRNTLPVEDIDGYFQNVNLGFAGLYSPEDAYIGTLVSALGALESGITSVFDWSHVQTTPEHTHATITALQDSGLRAVFGFGMPGRRDAGHAWPHDLLRLQKEYFSSRDQLLTLALATRGPEHAADDVAKADFTMARDAGLIVSAHVGINGSSKPDEIGRFGREGMLGPHVNLVHANTLSPAEWRIIADTGTSVSITPSTEMQMGQGVPPIQQALDVGYRPSLGVDVETSVPGDMWTQMRVTYGLQRMNVFERRYAGEDAPALMDLDDLLECAIPAGARAMRIDDKVGRIAPGMDADFILLRRDMLNVMPVNDLKSAVVLNMDARNVDSVFVRGRAVKRDGRMVGVDMPAIARRLYASRDRMFAERRQAMSPARWLD